MTGDRITGLVFLAFCFAYGVLAFQIELFPGSEQEAFTARTLPVGLAVAGCVISLLIVLFSGHKAQTGINFSRQNWIRASLLCVLMVAYGFAITTLGFVVSTTLFLLGGTWILGERRWLMLISVPIAVSIGFWVILTKLLGVYLESGLLL